MEEHNTEDKAILLAKPDDSYHPIPMGLPTPRLTLTDGITIIFGLMVGSGIFSSAGLIHADVGSAGMSLAVWVGTGGLALAGALCYGELGAAVPGSGGEAVYLERGFGQWAAFTFNWASCILLKPGSHAIIAVAFSKYFLMATTTDPSSWTVKYVALACLAVCTLLSTASPSIARHSQRILTAIKLATLLLVILAGPICLLARKGDKSVVKVAVDNLGRPFEGTIVPGIAKYASAVNHGLWAYEGWNNLNLVAGDLKNPGRNLPLSIIISLLAAMSSYLLLLISYYLILPASLISSSETIGVEFGKAVFGRTGAILMPVLISLCIFGACLSSIYTSAEVVIFAAKAGHMPSLLGTVNKTVGTPAIAYLMQAVLASGLVMASDFDLLVHIYTFPAWIFYGSSVLVILLLRWREPGLYRPYRVWPTTPILFLAACLLLITTSFYSHPLPIGLSLVTLLLALPVYYFLIRPSSPLQLHLRSRQALSHP